MRSRSWAIAAFVLFTSHLARAVSDPVDVIVYSDHVPAKTITGQPFQNPFVDGSTRLGLQTVPGLSLPSGTGVFYGLASWGKYVFVGNFEDNYRGFTTAVIAPQRIGLFNSESKEFCELTINAAPGVNASVEWIVPADPAATVHNRLYFNGFVNGSEGSFFGYIEADMNNPNPCDPATGWPVVGFTPAALNAAATSLGSAKRPCDSDLFCDFDGINVLSHDATAGDTLVMNNWFEGRVIVARIDAQGGLHVPDIRLLPSWSPAGSDGTCFQLLPVARPAIDPTRSGNDLRFTVGFDRQCIIPQTPPPCAPYTTGACPNSTTTCSVGGSCPTSYCTKLERYGLWFHRACSTDAECAWYGAGTCTNACLPVHPNMVCDNNPSQPCLNNDNCASGAHCTCSMPGIGKPAQEYRFDGTSITPTSALFQTDFGATSSFPVSYDSAGALWLRTDMTSFNGQPVNGVGEAIYLKQGNGEHAYSDLAHPDSSATASPDQVLVPPGSTNVFAAPWAIERLGGNMFLVGAATLWRAANAFGTWSTSAFAPSLGAGTLPGESGRCSGSQAVCDLDHVCPGGQQCVNSGGSVKPSIAIGGAPSSIWTAPDFAAPGRDLHALQSLYLLRVPFVTSLPDGAASVPPGMAWSGNRMWLVADHGGALSFRVRDNGFWSAWFALPTNLSLAGGAAVISNGASGGSSLELFARRASDGKIYTSSLTSALNCSPAICTWSSWTAIPVGGTLTTNTEPAVAYLGGGGDVTIVVHNAADDYVYYARRTSGAWTASWTKIAGLRTSSAPSIAFNANPGEARFWIAATEQTSGKVKVIKYVYPGSPTEWQEAGSIGSVLPWATAPTIAYDGSRMRLFVAQGTFPGWVHQLVHDGSAWGAWRVLSSQGIQTRQAAAANVNGTIDLATSWYTGGIQEQALE